MSFPRIQPSKWPFFYGYMIAISASIGLMMSGPGQTIGVSAFTDHLIAALSVSRFELSNAYMIGTIGSSLVVARAGRLIDRHGSRRIATIAVVLLGIVLLFLSQVDRIAFSLSGKVFDHVAALIAVTIGFFLIRFCGQGVLTLSCNTMLMRWFDRTRGRISSFVSIALTLAFSLIPLIFESLIRRFTWRGAWIVVGLVLIGPVALYLFTFFRDSAESCDLPLDGTSEKSQTKQQDDVPDWELSQVKRTYLFWVFSIGLGSFACVYTAIMFHVVSIFESAGLSRAQAVSVFLPISIIGVAVNITSGFLIDTAALRYRTKWFLLVFLMGMIGACAGVLLLKPLGQAWPLIIGAAIANGLFGILTSTTWPRYFGKKNLGAIAGYHMGFNVFFSAIGPSLFGLSFAATGGYQVAAIACMVAIAVLAIAALKADRPAFPALQSKSGLSAAVDD